MDGSDIAALLQVIGPIAGGVAAGQAGAADREQAQRILDALMKKYGALSTPELSDVPAEELGDTALAGISSDPKLKEAQYGALDALKQIQEMGGLTLDDQTALNKVQNKLARNESAGRNAIANDFAARGQLGSANQLAMSMQNQQDSANRAAEAGADTAANAQRRYFDSVMQRGRLGGEIDDREYRRKADAARARDAIAAHNASARTDAGRYRNDVANQRFSNSMGLAGAQAGAGYKQANYLENSASRKAETTGRAIDAGLKGASALLDDDDDKAKEWGNPYGGY